MMRVDGAYRRYLGRGAGAAERQHWLPVSKGSGDERLRESVMVSAEYVQRAQARFPG